MSTTKTYNPYDNVQAVVKNAAAILGYSHDVSKQFSTLNVN